MDAFISIKLLIKILHRKNNNDKLWGDNRDLQTRGWNTESDAVFGFASSIDDIQSVFSASCLFLPLPTNLIKSCLAKYLFPATLVWFPSKQAWGSLPPPLSPFVMLTGAGCFAATAAYLHA